MSAPEADLPPVSAVFFALVELRVVIEHGKRCRQRRRRRAPTTRPRGWRSCAAVSRGGRSAAAWRLAAAATRLVR